MENLFLFRLRRRAPTLIRWILRTALFGAGVSALALFSLLVWSTGNASRYAQQYDLLLVLNGVLAATLISWVLLLTIRLFRQIRRRQFGARMTARFAFYFTLIGIIPGALIYLLSVQFMSRSIESWFNVRVDTALESGLSLGRAALDSQLNELEGRANEMVSALNKADSAQYSSLLISLRENSGVTEAMVFSGNGRLIAFSSGRYDTLLGSLGGAELPALGFGMGDVVLGELLRARELFPSVAPSVDYWLAGADEGLEPELWARAAQLRAVGRSVEYALRPQSLAKQFKAAGAAGARHIAIFSRENIAAGQVSLRSAATPDVPAQAMAWMELLEMAKRA